MAPKQIKLRTIPVCDRYFWKDNAEQQSALCESIVDQNAAYLTRKLPANEVTVMALNEIAVHQRRGFFMHLPPRTAWTTTANPQRVPAERTALQPGPLYANVVYMDFVWTKENAERFLCSTQRGRYLKASFLTNIPPACTPLHLIQFTPQRTPVFITSSSSLVLFVMQASYVVHQTSELERIVGRDSKGPGKLGSTHWLWDVGSLEVGKNRTQRWAKYHALMQYAVKGLDEVYDNIMKKCRDLPDTLTAGDLQKLFPRPRQDSSSRVGTSLGITGPIPTSIRPRGNKRKACASLSPESGSQGEGESKVKEGHEQGQKAKQAARGEGEREQCEEGGARGGGSRARKRKRTEK